MKYDFSSLPRDEQLTLQLRALFVRRGYRRYRMSNFEAYDLYRENKTFLNSEGIITFNDASGRLMALKPDVTMSIVKNTKEGEIERLYYNESVFRLEPRSHEYSEISQMGVEYIGGGEGYAEAEVVKLALESLDAIGGETVLNISHMGFITGLFAEIGMEGAVCEAALAALRGKNAQMLEVVARSAGCNTQQIERLLTLVRIGGAFIPALAAAKKLAQGNKAMQNAVSSLETLFQTLVAMGGEQSLRLDFSASNAIDYYNGILFQGYSRGVPHAVLSGGRYDRLMQRLGKPQAAVGFAVYLSEIARALAQNADYDVDILLLYGADIPPALVASAIEKELAAGHSIRAEQSMPQNICARRVVTLIPNGSLEELSC